MDGRFGGYVRDIVFSYILMSSPLVSSFRRKAEKLRSFLTQSFSSTARASPFVLHPPSSVNHRSYFVLRPPFIVCGSSIDLYRYRSSSVFKRSCRECWELREDLHLPRFASDQSFSLNSWRLP